MVHTVPDIFCMLAQKLYSAKNTLEGSPLLESGWELEGRSLVIGGEPLTSLLQIHFALEIPTWELEFFTSLTMLTWCLDGSHVEWQSPGENPQLPHGGSLSMLRVWAFILWPSSHWLLSLFWLLMIVVSFSIITLDILLWAMATLYLLGLLRAWGLVKLSIVWALDVCLWTPSIKLE